MIAERNPVLAFLAGIVLVVLALAVVPFTSGAQATGAGLGPCPLAEVALDPGYGNSRTELRPVCSR